MKNNKATFAIYQNKSDVRGAIRALRNLGFGETDLTVLHSRRNGAKDFAQIQKNQVSTGAIVGAIVGAIFGSVGIGGLYFFVGAGLMPATYIESFSAVSGTFAAVMVVLLSTMFGAACGTLVGIGTPDPAAKRYGQYLQSGGILLSVHNENSDQITKAEKILETTGGQDIHVAVETPTWDAAIMESIKLSDLEWESQISGNPALT